MGERLSPEPLILHIYPNCIKFGNGDESFVHGGAMMLFLKALEKGGLPAEFVGLFDSVVKYKNGSVNVQIYDHRGNSTTHTATTLHTTTSENNNESKVDVVQLDLRDDPGLIWNEIWKMAGGLSAKSLEDGMLELESKILVR
ncbi:hypothetical protein BKA69DRAFT_827546 [Paraphysoderma sedebokerense]|nr:hypothetical protein BKA69DRAFT_827546 [Paraphysoderma sedebokerense]